MKCDWSYKAAAASYDSCFNFVAWVSLVLTKLGLCSTWNYSYEINAPAIGFCCYLLAFMTGWDSAEMKAPDIGICCYFTAFITGCSCGCAVESYFCTAGWPPFFSFRWSPPFLYFISRFFCLLYSSFLYKQQPKQQHTATSTMIIRSLARWPAVDTMITASISVKRHVLSVL